MSGKLPKVEYKKILYATDLSEAGRYAFPYAASIASRYDADLTVFHVVETEEFEKYVVGYISEDLWSRIKTRTLQEAREALVSRKRDDTIIKDAIEKYCQQAIAHEEENCPVAYNVVVKTGDPVETIVEESRVGAYDLIVVAHVGRRGMQEHLMGSTARRLLHYATVPVLVVQLPDQPG